MKLPGIKSKSKTQNCPCDRIKTLQKPSKHFLLL